MSDEVRYEVTDAVATVTLNRPAALNALTTAMKEELLAVLRNAAEDPAVRAVVLTGEGRAFCVGQDLREHTDTLAAGGGATMETVRQHYNPIVLTLATMPKPVVAAVNGMAAGAGAGLAFACDLRIASDTAGFLMAFAKVGLTGDSGVTWTLPRLAGPLAAAELLMLAEPIDANRARQLGLVTDVVPAGELADRVATLANTLAAGPTTAYAAIKESLQFSAAHSLAETLEQEALLQARCGSTADHEAATRAFLAKQPVVFTGS